MKNKIEQNFIDMMMAHDIYDGPIISYLRNNKFFNQPASTKYHLNYEGGLAEHSLNVATSLLELTKKLDLTWERYRSPVLVGLFHDLCKIDNYTLHGNFFDYNKPILTGHGDKSVILLSQFYKLTEEEIFCIRFHMGAYEKDNWDNYDKAIKKYENVLYTHTADMIASKIMED